MERSEQNSLTKNNNNKEPKANASRIENRDAPITDTNNPRNDICDFTETKSCSVTPSNSNVNGPDTIQSLETNAKTQATSTAHEANLTNKNDKPPVDTSRLSGSAKKKASFFSRQFLSFDGSSPSPVERFQSAIATAKSVFSSSVSSHTTTTSSNVTSKECTVSSNSSKADTNLSAEAISKNESTPKHSPDTLPKHLNVGTRKKDTNETDKVSNSVIALLSPSSAAKHCAINCKLSVDSKNSRKKGRKRSSFLKRSGSHSPSIKRSPTRIATENGSSCINLTVSDRSGPSSGNTTPSPRSFRRSAESHQRRGEENISSSSVLSCQPTAVRITQNTLTVPSTSSAYGAIPRTATTNQSRTQLTTPSNDEPPRRCFCGHYTEVTRICSL